jgi:hypothetical protein
VGVHVDMLHQRAALQPHPYHVVRPVSSPQALSRDDAGERLPSPTTAWGPITTFGPILQSFPILAVSCCRQTAEGQGRG